MVTVLLVAVTGVPSAGEATADLTDAVSRAGKACAGKASAAAPRLAPALRRPARFFRTQSVGSAPPDPIQRGGVLRRENGTPAKWLEAGDRFRDAANALSA
ncbi:hypothetical protein ACIPLC_11885 [Kitasatospora sp. NPDC086801]|uniref:hypothetical protein n=1 Tax=Kitasatospora sp. NPDC086801 TaxID=3364066 RepID=UPI00380DEEC9